MFLRDIDGEMDVDVTRGQKESVAFAERFKSESETIEVHVKAFEETKGEEAAPFDKEIDRKVRMFDCASMKLLNGGADDPGKELD